VPYNFNKF